MHFELRDVGADVITVDNFDGSIKFEFFNGEVNGELTGSIDGFNVELEIGISKKC